jgi:hypothetical protein
MRYNKQNDPQSAYAIHILNNKQAYEPVNNTTSSLKHVKKGPLLIPFERFYIQSHYHHNQLVLEQNTGDRNPMYQLIFDLHITVTQNTT